MTKKITHLALALVTLLTGCSMIPTYERPAAPVPTGFPNVTASERHSTLPSWRTYFAEPRLQQLIELALNNNRDLRIASLNVEQARAQFQVRRAAQYPAVGLAANASRAPASGTGNITNNFSVGLAVTAWELDFFGRVASLKEQALAQYLATEEGRNAAQVSLISSVANGWLNLLADEELLELSRRTLATREESGRLTKLRLDSGAASELDYRQAESLAQAARATLAQQQRQRALDENALALLLGQPLPEDIRATLGRSDLNAAPAMQTVPAGLPSDLLVQRPDIRQAEQQLIAANANIGAARAAFFPRISLTAQAGTTSGELSGLFKNGSWGFTSHPHCCCHCLMRAPIRPIWRAHRHLAAWPLPSTKKPSRQRSEKWRTRSPAKARSQSSWRRSASKPKRNPSASSWQICATRMAWPATSTCWMRNGLCSAPSRAWCKFG